MNRPWVAIQRNPTSGAGPKRKLLIDLVTRLREHGIGVRMFSRRERLEQRLARPGARDKLICIVAAGGDGTVGDVVNRYPGLPLAILPLGTENLLARYLGIPKCGRFVADMIVGRRSQQFDLGVLGERRFTLVASVGFDAEVIRRTHARRMGHITKFSYFQPIWQTLRKYSYPEIRIFVDDAETPVRARWGILANLPAYALGLPFAADSSGSDGLLDLRLFERGSMFQMIRYYYKVVLGKHEKLIDVQSRRAKCVRIESDVPVPIQVDGDPAGWTPAEVRLLPTALELFVPADFAKC